MNSVWDLFGLGGLLSISVLLLLLGALSRRLGSVTNAAAYYRGFYLASILVGLGLIARLLSPPGITTTQDAGILWVLLLNGLPAVGITLGLVVAWRYWSWLLAERD